MFTKSGTELMVPESKELNPFKNKWPTKNFGCSDASVNLASEDVLDAVSGFYINPYEQILAFSVSGFWVGRIL